MTCRTFTTLLVGSAVVLSACGGSSSTGGTPSNGTSATHAYRTAGMAVTVPGEWTRVSQPTQRGVSVLYLADPRHVQGGMTFSVITAKDPVAANLPLRTFADKMTASIESDPSFSNVHGGVVGLPVGKAFHAQSTVTKNGETFTDIKYGLLRGNRVYVVTFMGLPALMRSHAAQITAAANSIEWTG